MTSKKTNRLIYTIEEVVFTNAVKLKLPTIMRIHLVVNMSQVVRYKKPVKIQRVEKPKPVEVDEEKEWKFKKTQKTLGKWQQILKEE